MSHWPENLLTNAVFILENTVVCGTVPLLGQKSWEHAGGIWSVGNANVHLWDSGEKNMIHMSQ